MRTGLKILTRKVIKKLLNVGFVSDKFPETPISNIQLKTRLMSLNNDLSHFNANYNLGSLHTRPNRYLSEIYGSILKYNPNHLGNWSTKPSEYTTQMEFEVVKKMIDLYHAQKEGLEGYITSGGTEGNIFSLWAGRSYLSQFCKKNQIALLCTNLTHYSLRKAGDLCAVSQHYVPLDPVNWGMDSRGLHELVKKLVYKGTRGFLLPLTIGYTSTGTQDDIIKIVQTVNLLQKEDPHIHFYIWIDAALCGLIEPFINSDYSPFISPLINSIVVDFHKLGLVPYSAGVVLYRKKLRELIEQPIDYLQASDCTLLGSRPGAAAVAIWTAIHLFGKRGYVQIISEQMQNKDYFISEMHKHFPSVELINYKNSLSCGIIFNQLIDRRLPSLIEEKYFLYLTKTKLLFYSMGKKEKEIYTFFFLPHIKRKIVKELIEDLKSITTIKSPE